MFLTWPRNKLLYYCNLLGSVDLKRLLLLNLHLFCVWWHFKSCKKLLSACLLFRDTGHSLISYLVKGAHKTRHSLIFLWLCLFFIMRQYLLSQNRRPTPVIDPRQIKCPNYKAVGLNLSWISAKNSVLQYFLGTAAT